MLLNVCWAAGQIAPRPATPITAARNAQRSDDYQYKETRQLVQLVNDAADLLRAKGEAAFTDFRRPGSHWRQEETYIFVLDPKGNMLVHPDATMEGKNELELKRH